MSVKVEGREMLKQKKIKDSTDVDYAFVGLGNLSESEIQWVKLHQMFDR